MAQRIANSGSETRHRYHDSNNNNMFQELNGNDSFNNYGDEDGGEEEFHDSRVVKTVRSLKRQK